MRNLSFALTTPQMRARTKTVTRRRGTYWMCLKPGELVCAVEKSQGIKRGGLVRIGVIRVTRVRVECLDQPWEYGDGGLEEATREGFPDLTWGRFIAMFRDHMGGAVDQTVTRIEFEHTDIPAEEPKP